MVTSTATINLFIFLFILVFILTIWTTVVITTANQTLDDIEQLLIILGIKSDDKDTDRKRDE